MSRVLWCTGLPAAGKTTVARLVAAGLRARGEQVEILDGDEIRSSLSSDLGFSREDRDENIRRVAARAEQLSRGDVYVIAAVVSPYRAGRAQARALLGDRFIEIFVDAPLELCVKRDPKGLYAAALAGETDRFTGVSDPYEVPHSPEVTLTTATQSPQESADMVLSYLDAADALGADLLQLGRGLPE